MTDHKIHCPECNAEFPLSESIAAEHIAAEQARLKSTYDRKAVSYTHLTLPTKRIV